MKIVIKNKRKHDQYHKSFFRIFGIRLSRFFNLITGFDIVKFDDEVLHSQDGESSKDVVQREYGNEGVKIIMSLI